MRAYAIQTAVLQQVEDFPQVYPQNHNDIQEVYYYLNNFDSAKLIRNM